MRALALLLLAGTSAIAQEDLTEELAAEIAPDASGLVRKEGKLGDAARAKFKTAMGVEAPAKVVYFEGEAELLTGESGKLEKVRICVVPLKTKKGGGQLGVCVAPAVNTIVGVTVKMGDQEFEEVPFFMQFTSYDYSSDAIGRPMSHLDATLKKAAQAADDEQKNLRGLVAQQQLMRRIQISSDTLSGKLERQEASTAEAKELKKVFDAVDKSIADLKFFSAKDKKDFGEWMTESRASLADIEAGMGAGDMEKAQEGNRRLLTACNKCHTAYETLFREKREPLGLGTGYFRADFDLGTDPGVDGELQKAAASAVRKAVLMLEEVK
ncbi:MAG: hypothetical protein HYY16_18315 [Planctomycetes bacterium]|nr:hypothetical protein [Planctomycetota bacterium]